MIKYFHIARKYVQFYLSVIKLVIFLYTRGINKKIKNDDIITKLKISNSKLKIHESQLVTGLSAQPTVILPLTQCLSRAGH